MSNFLAPLTLQVPCFSSLREGLEPARDCVLCLARCRDVVCGPCASRLRVLEAACARCALPLPLPGLCPTCRRQPPAFDDAAGRFEYAFPLDRLVQRFKYGGDLAVGRWLGRELARRVREEKAPDLLVVPPLSRGTLHERGFNQALELAKVVASELRVDLDRDAITRRRATAHQARLGRRERRSNLRGAFECRLPLRGVHVAIVDDVMTTGATADALASVLKATGAARVSVWVVARAPDPAA